MGLRLLPWILGMRSEYKDKKLLDCERCLKNTTRQYRRKLNCGWLPKSEHTGPGARINVPFRFPSEEVSECPGWLIQLPRVYETQVAYFWTEKGMLRERYPGNESLELLMSCVQVMSAEQRAVEEWRMTPADKR